MNKTINARRVYLAYAHLRGVARDFENELGLGNLSNTELDLLAVAIQLCENSDVFSTAQILEHPLMQGAARATIYRAIASLEAGDYFIVKQTGTKTAYSLGLFEDT